jgi:hypothetical protein
MFIPDPNFFHSGSRIQGKKDSGSASKNFSISNQKIVAKLSEIRDRGCLSLIRIPDPGVEKAPDPGPEYATPFETPLL